VTPGANRTPGRLSISPISAAVEEFLLQLAVEMPELVDASMIYGEERENLKEDILIISVEGLMPAFEHLKNIRASVGQKILELNRRQLFRTSRAGFGMEFGLAEASI
jgi:hypothetical protein